MAYETKNLTNNTQERTYKVETEDQINEVTGTGFHLSGGHLVIEGADENKAAFAPGRWLQVWETLPEEPTKITVTFPNGFTVDDAVTAMERMNEHRNNNLGGLL